MSERCPCCGSVWPGPDRIALLGLTVVTPRGWYVLAPKSARLLRAIHERRGGLPVAEFYAHWPRARRPGDSACSWVTRMNRRLARLGWRLLRITHRDGTDAYGLVEILRNAENRLCGPAPAGQGPGTKQ